MKHKNALKRFSITSEKDGSWHLSEEKDKGCDAPMRVCATLNEAIDYALYFDHAWDRANPHPDVGKFPMSGKT